MPLCYAEQQTLMRAWGRTDGQTEVTDMTDVCSEVMSEEMWGLSVPGPSWQASALVSSGEAHPGLCSFREGFLFLEATCCQRSQGRGVLLRAALHQVARGSRGAAGCSLTAALP